MGLRRTIPEVAAIHDLSGYGRSALTIVIPVLSSMGVQVCPLPTAVLSSQTDGFDNYAMLDLTDFMPEISEHWELMDLQFDAVYSGFLGSAEQISFVSHFIKKFRRKNQIILVDPVLGDNGLPYGPINGNHIKGMRKLISSADIITPNVTEASMLLHRQIKKCFSGSEMREWLSSLAASGPDVVMITSVPFESENNYAVCVYDKKGDRYMKFGIDLVAGSYPGTGDTFASVVLGGLLRGQSLEVSISHAIHFLHDVILFTNQAGTPNRNGLLLEGKLCELSRKFDNCSYESF